MEWIFVLVPFERPRDSTMLSLKACEKFSFCATLSFSLRGDRGHCRGDDQADQDCCYVMVRLEAFESCESALFQTIDMMMTPGMNAITIQCENRPEG